MKDIRYLYSFHSIRSAAAAFINVFIPIVFLKAGFSLPQIFKLWIIASLCIMAFSFLAAYLSKKVGFKPLIVFSIFLQFFILFLLHVVGANTHVFYIIGILVGLQTAFYWLPVNFLFSYHSDKNKLGSDTGKFFAIPKILKIPVPIISALIILYFGFDALYIVSGIFYLISLYPLYYLPKMDVSFSFDINKYTDLFKRYTKYFFAEFLENIREEFEAVILPIVIFITLKSVVSVGLVSSLAPIGASLFTLLIGKLSDTKNKRSLMRVGALTMIIFWILRMLFPNQSTFYIASTAVGFFEALVLIPFSSIIYANAKKENTTEFLLFREVSVGAARIFVYTMALLFAGEIIYLFSVPALSLGLFMLY